MPHPSSACASLLAIALAFVLLPPPSIAAPASKKAARKAQPASPARAAPDVTATIPQPEKTKATPQPTSPVIDDEDDRIPAPFNLPTASRARMRTCGESWQAMKMSGEAHALTWRAYATKCLASREPVSGSGGPSGTQGAEAPSTTK